MDANAWLAAIPATAVLSALATWGAMQSRVSRLESDIEKLAARVQLVETKAMQELREKLEAKMDSLGTHLAEQLDRFVERLEAKIGDVARDEREHGQQLALIRQEVSALDARKASRAEIPAMAADAALAAVHGHTERPALQRQPSHPEAIPYGREVVSVPARRDPRRET